LVRKALLLIEQSIDALLSIGRVVTRLRVSRRKLERHFRKALGVTPLEADRLIRIEQAKYLLKTTERSATQIAADTGFCELPHLIRVFRAAEDDTGRVSADGNAYLTIFAISVSRANEHRQTTTLTRSRPVSQVLRTRCAVEAPGARHPPAGRSTQFSHVPRPETRTRDYPSIAVAARRQVLQASDRGRC
jgi:hypothetical protein